MKLRARKKAKTDLRTYVFKHIPDVMIRVKEINVSHNRNNHQLYSTLKTFSVLKHIYYEITWKSILRF